MDFDTIDAFDARIGTMEIIKKNAYSLLKRAMEQIQGAMKREQYMTNVYTNVGEGDEAVKAVAKELTEKHYSVKIEAGGLTIGWRNPILQFPKEKKGFPKGRKPSNDAVGKARLGYD